jgi:hypothetical protein
LTHCVTFTTTTGNKVMIDKSTIAGAIGAAAGLIAARKLVKNKKQKAGAELGGAALGVIAAVKLTEAITKKSTPQLPAQGV